ncbi:hypothetical protein [Kibdelosporangium aridum]|uniref:hypothetical protein n=1 Tax=Kibdelosporangium aridum TaxID=2030 RepID=UPI000AABB8CD|nr:hypothetical protein [Kibdelosporangium aridum]
MTAHSRRFARICREHFGESPKEEAAKPAEGTDNAAETQPDQAESVEKDKAS